MKTFLKLRFTIHYVIVERETDSCATFKGRLTSDTYLKCFVKNFDHMIRTHATKRLIQYFNL